MRLDLNTPSWFIKQRLTEQNAGCATLFILIIYFPTKTNIQTKILKKPIIVLAILFYFDNHDTELSGWISRIVLRWRDNKFQKLNMTRRDNWGENIRIASRTVLLQSRTCNVAFFYLNYHINVQVDKFTTFFLSKCKYTFPQYPSATPNTKQSGGRVKNVILADSEHCDNGWAVLRDFISLICIGTFRIYSKRMRICVFVSHGNKVWDYHKHFLL